MRVALIYDAVFPVHAYGGTERVVWNVAHGLHEQGHHVTLVCLPGSTCPYGEVAFGERPFPPKNLPAADVYHYFNTPPVEPNHPYVVTIGGNGKPGEVFLPNTVFISKNHAQRHGASIFVYNGIDPEEYRFSENKKKYLLFLAKASWRVKNVRGAIRIARKSGNPLKIVGGSRWWCPSWRGVQWMGMLGGSEKAHVIAGAQGLVFPVQWHEPFGLAVVEALVSGTPVLASPFGSLPELVSPEVGRICHSYSEFVQGVKELGSFRAKACRDWVFGKFHYRTMASSYVRLYEQVRNGQKLHSQPITTPDFSSSLLELPD